MWRPTNESLEPHHHQYFPKSLQIEFLALSPQTTSPDHSIDCSLGKQFSYWGSKAISKLENAGIPYSKVTKARMLIHPGFPVRMVQWGGKSNSSAPIIEQAARQTHTAQVNLLWPTIFDSFLPSRKRSVSGKDQIPIHLVKDLQRKPNWVRQRKGRNTRGLSWNKPHFPLLS